MDAVAGTVARRVVRVAAGIALLGLDGRGDSSLEDAVILFDKADVVWLAVVVPVKEDNGSRLCALGKAKRHWHLALDLGVLDCGVLPARAVAPVELPPDAQVVAGEKEHERDEVCAPRLAVCASVEQALHVVNLWTPVARRFNNAVTHPGLSVA